MNLTMGKSAKIISIIVPSYNMEKYLPKCLGSLVVAPELMERLEVLVVNDGSKDRTSEIAHEFEARHPGVFRVIDKPNGNYGSCINAALPLCAGVFVKVLDADDYVNTEGFGQLLKVLGEERQEGGADLVVSDYEQVDPDGKILCRVNFGLNADGIKTLDEKPMGGERFSIHGIAYRTELLKKMGYRQSEGKSYTDTEWIIEPMAKVRNVRYLPVAVTCYLLGRAGQTMEVKTFARKFQQLVEITEGLVKRYEVRMSQAEPTSRTYYRSQVLAMVQMVYFGCILGWRGHKVVANLKAFDDALRAFPELYSASGSFQVPSRHFPLRYVREWRKHKNCLTWRLLLLRVYLFVVARIRRIPCWR